MLSIRSAGKPITQDTSLSEFKSKGMFYGWWVVILSIVGMMFSVGPVAVYTFGIFVKPLVKSFSSNRGTVSLAISILNIGAAISLPLFGFIVDRIGARKVIAFGLTAFAICLFALSIVGTSVWQLLFLYGMIGVLASGSSPVSFSRVVANWFNRKRGFALGIATTGIGLGGFILPSLTQFLIERFSWRQAYLILSIPVLLILIDTLLYKLTANH